MSEKLLLQIYSELLEIKLTIKSSASTQEESQLDNDKAISPWLTDAELAKYWGLTSTSGIRKWTRRKADAHPLPHSRMGDLLRFNRNEVDQWSREEAVRSCTMR